jgi:Pyruvate/2-oxoacid:ferredoxin oxidoreductase delta subunit
MASQFSVFVSRSRSTDPAKIALEESIVAALDKEPHIRIRVIPPLYDLRPGSLAVQAMRDAAGDTAVLSWIYERAARWVLHSLDVRGFADEVSEAESQETAASSDRRRRTLTCLDLRSRPDAASFAEAIRQLAQGAEWYESAPNAERADTPGSGEAGTLERRWYPVIDYARCTNCMECIDFCLFGVYGVDDADRILVEQPDQCRKGCPACSRVCPEHAIMFPMHATPAIAGATGDVVPLKLDLSQIFGGAAEPGDARTLAMSERERHLKPVRPEAGSDRLDQLLDELDEFDARE